MELFLNAAWFAVALIAICVPFVRRRLSKDRRELWIPLIALLCATVVLFPSISASDDLHFDAFVVEDSTLAKRLQSAHSSPAPANPLFWIPVFLLLGFFAWFERQWLIGERIRACYRTPFFNRHLPSRAPPAVPTY